MKKKLIIYIIFFISLVLISCLSLTELDGIWGYGFSYNIARGLIPYKDFNMIVGPLYSLIMSLFIKLFGNYFIVFVIENSLIYAFVFLALYEKLGKKSIYILLLLGCCLTSFGYNTFCCMLVLAIIMLLDSNYKHKNIYIGIIIGMILMVKHNIGLSLLMVFLFTNRKSKHKLELFTSILFPIIPVLIYLIVNDILYGYIDFCYLGVGNFLDNLYIDIMTVPIAFYILYFLVKEYIKTKNDIILYILAFSVILFPIMDQGHVIPALIPFTYYCLLDNSNKKLLFLLKYFIIVGVFVTLIISRVFSSTISFKDNYLFLQRIKPEWYDYLKNYSNYLDDFSGKKVYLFLDNAYLIKIYRNEDLGFYDLCNKGNYGNNEQKYIEMLEKECSNTKCVYILDELYFKMKYGDQRILLFKDYVLDNGFYLETIPSGDKVYTNYNN